jgi:hypothetical protein
MSEKTLKLIARIPMLVFLLVAVVLTVMFLVGVSGTDDRATLLRVVGPSIVYTYVLAAIAVVLLLGFLLVKLVTNPRSGIKALLGFGLLVLVFVVAYAISSNEPLQMPNGTLYGVNADPKVAAEQMRDVVMTDIGIIATYILIALALVSLVVTGVLSFFKK